MHLSAGFSLALLGTAANIACGFSLNPSLSHKNYLSLKKNDSLPSPIGVYTNQFNHMNTLEKIRGGTNAAGVSELEAQPSGGFGKTAASLWAAGGVVMILAKSIKRILPIALEPFSTGAIGLSRFQLGSYIAMCLWFAYVEGYKGFQLKFSPLVVARAQTLKPFNGSPIHHILFGPFYAMGLFHATKKRKIVSWSVSTGVAVIVAAVKKLPYPWRNIVDAGVIVGLSWGSLSIMIGWVKAAIMGIDLKTDPALPESK